MTIGALIVALVLLFIIYHGANLAGLLFYLFVLAVIGMVAGRLMRGRDYGILGNIVLGFFGGIIGPFLLWMFGLGGIVHIPFIGYGIAGVLGSMVMIFLMRLVDRNFAR